MRWILQGVLCLCSVLIKTLLGNNSMHCAFCVKSFLCCVCVCGVALSLLVLMCYRPGNLFSF